MVLEFFIGKFVPNVDHQTLTLGDLSLQIGLEPQNLCC